MIIAIVFTLSINYMFSSGGVSGKMFGRYIYIMETAEMQPEIEKGSAVIASEDGITVLTEGNVILFKNGGREDVMRIKEVVHNTDSTVYRASLDSSPESTVDVSKENVIAKCTTESHNLGAVIRFLKSIPGILIGMILPCIIILAFLIFKIISIRKADGDEDTYQEDEEEDGSGGEFEGFNGKPVKSRSTSPLFNPEEDINPGDDFERKKSSIAQNFGRKPAADKKRSEHMDQTVPKAAVERFKAAVDEKPNAPVMRKSTLVPENANPDVSEKLAAIKAALSQKNENQDVNAQKAVEPDISGRTSAFKAVKPQQQNSGVSQKPVRKNTAQKRTQTGKDNINSIDDLIKALEEEKRKL
jgi:hypothetical protein